MAPLVIAIIMFAKPLLYLWVGRDFAENSALVLQFLAIGVFVTSIGSVPYTVLQAIGRPDVTAKIHLVELPIYLVMIMTLPLIMGLTGVALSWTVRSLGDALIMSWSARRHTSARLGNEQESPVRMLIFVGGVLVTAYVLASFESMTFKISAYLTAVSVMAILSWKFWMLPPDRQFLRQLVKST
jgi:O-antigen/teichoic acid export membrane protein